MDKSTVLIVEDEAIVAADLAGKLVQLGYGIAGIVAGGEEAVEAACSLKPAVVLMDISLKGPMDGIEAAETIRRRVDVPVIYLTAHSDAATLDRAKHSGPFGYILKPFEERELSTTIEMALYKHLSDRRLREQQEALRRSHDELERRVEERTSELRDANESAKAERQRLYDVLETLPVYVILLDSDYRVPFANRFFRERFGESHGRRCYEYLFSRSEPCEICETFKVLKTNAPCHWFWTGPDGCHYDIYDYPFRDADGTMMILEMGIDITKRKEAEEALRLANAYNRSLIEASPDPLVTIGHDGKITDVNAATEAATGRSRGELIGTDFSDYFSAPDKARAGYEQVFREGSVRDYPLELCHRDGRLTSVLYNASVYRDEKGEVIGVFAAARDITELKRAEAALMALNDTLEEQVVERTAQLNSANETLRASRLAALNLMEDAVVARKQAEEKSEELRLEVAERKKAEEALQESEERFRTLADNMSQLCWMANADGWIFWYNKRWYEYTGTTPEEMEGWGWQSVHDPEVLPLVMERWKETISTGKPFDMVFPLRSAGGEFRPFLTRVMPVYDQGGTVVRWFGTNTDITERKQAEESLRKSNRRLDLLNETAGRLLASHSPQLVVNELCAKVVEFLDCHAFFNFLVDEETGCLRLNAYGGIPEEEASKIEWLDYGTAVCGCAARDACRIVAEDIPNTPDPRTDLVKSYGIKAYACHPLMAQGRVLGTLSFGTRSRPRFTDDELSLMKAVADQVAIAMERKRVEEELRRAKEAAESASRTKTQFLANMSHELRTPLTGVLGMLEIARGGPLEEKQREAVDTANMSGKLLLMIINDILDLTRIEAGKFHIEEKPFILRKSVADCVNFLKPEALRKGLGLDWAVADDVPEAVTGDRMRLQQVLTNLIGNAVKFTETGKIGITVTAGNKAPDGRRGFTFTVNDTGIGIADDKKSIIFDPFSQADLSHTRRYGGTGLGLTISRQIVELMGGTITLESREGEGSTFSFTVPLLEADAGSREAEGEAESAVPVAASGTRARLLVAEDDEVTRRVLDFMFRQYDFDLQFAPNGRAALDLWERGKFDLIIMDGQMPEMDGFSATRAIRERELERGGRIPIIAMTAHAFPEDEKRCLDAGMDAYVAKPIDFKRCVALIRNMLAGGEGKG